MRGLAAAAGLDLADVLAAVDETVMVPRNVLRSVGAAAIPSWRAATVEVVTGGGAMLRLCSHRLKDEVPTDSQPAEWAPADSRVVA